MTGVNVAGRMLVQSEFVTGQETIGGKLNWGRWVVLALIGVGVGLFLAFGPDEETIIRRSAEWRELARNNLAAALALFCVVEMILIALSLPVGIWLTVLAGFLFGTRLGTAVVNLGGTAGAIGAFLAARYAFAEVIHRSAETRPRLTRLINAVDEGFRNHGAYYVLLLRLTPIFPFFAVNLGLGLTSVRLRDYWWATQLGMVPISLVIAHAGASLAEITSFREVLSWHVLGALSMLPLVPFALHHTVGRVLAKTPHF